MGKDWQDCIITLIDLVGVKNVTQSGMGSSVMRKLHAAVGKELRAGRPCARLERLSTFAVLR